LKKITYILASISLLIAIYSFTFQNEESYKIAVLKYNGGGDWYANPTAIPNLVAFTNQNIKTNIYI
jgi:hypothetical protein